MERSVPWRTTRRVASVCSWFDDNARPSPAELHPLGVVVSEFMLQQTAPVHRVEPVWQDWMKRWPTPPALASEPSGEAVRAWGRLGYPRRALRLHATAQQITDQHSGRVPPAMKHFVRSRVSGNTQLLPFVPSHSGSNPQCWTSTCVESSPEPGAESTSHHPT